MIIKIVRTSSSENLLDYLVNQQHKILDSKGVLPYQDIESIKKEFHTRELTNHKAKNIAYNIIVSFPSEDNITKLVRLKVLEDVMQEFNGGSDLWFAVAHPDSINHQHFHCALSAIKLDGNSIDMSNFSKRAMALSRKLEKKYHLKCISNERSMNSNQSINALRFAIDHAINEAQHMDEFIAIMRLTGYKCKVSRGITFIKLENNHPIKGSAVGREYSLGNLLKKFENKIEIAPDTKIGRPSNVKPMSTSRTPDFIDLILESSPNTNSSIDNADEEVYKKKRRKKRTRR